MRRALSRLTGTTEADNPTAGIATRTGGLACLARDNRCGTGRVLIAVWGCTAEGVDVSGGTAKEGAANATR